MMRVTGHYYQFTKESLRLALMINGVFQGFAGLKRRDICRRNGDFVIIAGQSWPAKISRQRDNLIALIEKNGFSQTMEAVAYTWFNRFAALRYMEIHDYLKHGYRVLSSREGGLPEILNAAPELAQKRELPDLNPQQVIELKLAGDQDGELYRLTLIAQCNALSSVMPFLFERIDNETELLLPDNLLLTDSVIAKLVEAIRLGVRIPS